MLFFRCADFEKRASKGCEIRMQPGDSEANDSEPIDIEDERLLTDGKVCPKCGAWQMRDITSCTECGARPVTWRPEYRILLWFLLVLSVGLILFTTMGGSQLFSK